jgi:uridine kinase
MWVGPNKEKFQLHIELDRKAYWNLVQDAAEHEQHPEEFLESYLNTMWQATNSEEL